MHLSETDFQGLYLIQNPVHQDERGAFFKPFEWKDIPVELGVFDPKEIYYSINRAHVIRGMHFQIPPCDHSKLVWVSKGSILDVVLDIRKGSETYGKFFTRTLDSHEGICILIPSGFAHGFLCIEEDSIVNYAQTSGYDKACDAGIRFDSFGFEWPEESPIVSTRDLAFPSFAEFLTEFA